MLADRKAKATFFVVGSYVTQYPQYVLQAFQAGHQIGIHTWSHRALTSQSTEVIVAELEWTALAIQRVIGVRPKYFRPPYGML
jgi:peptidoglycan/xylan/chitin deacetylase (PgdA/CDA1 family)